MYAEYRQRELNEKGEISTLLVFLDGLKSRMLKNYGRTLRMTQSLKIKWRI